jgi:nicotinamide-nucleotide amidase
LIIDLINTGSELMLGRVLNTNQQWLCRALADLGYVVTQQIAISDSAVEIQSALRDSLSRADLIITTGGLGPTSDDLTRDVVSQLLGKPLREDPAVVAHIAEFFTARNRAMPARTRVQALVPQDAMVLPNAHGTAPGLAIEIPTHQFRSSASPTWLLMLPGPPRELRPMFTDSVKPLLQRVLPLEGKFVCRTLRSTGIGESMVEEKVAGPLSHLVRRGLEIGYCARPGEVDVRLVARGSQAEQLVAGGEQIVRAQIGGSLYGIEEEELETVIVRLLTERNETLAVAESCTGGCLANRLTNVPGASAVLLAGLVTYSNEAKQLFLGVQAETLAQHGAVSAPVAREMVEGARQRTGATHALSLTGVAGPGGGTDAKPVGTVFIGLA